MDKDVEILKFTSDVWERTR